MNCLRRYIALEIVGTYISGAEREILERFEGRLIHIDPIWSVQGKDAWMLQFTSKHPDLFLLLQEALTTEEVFAYRVARNSVYN